MDRISQLLRQQHGLITAEQARAGGMTYRQLQHRVASGAWVRMRNGVYQLATTPQTWESRLRSAVLGRTCVVSGPPASVLWGLEVFKEPKPEITVSAGPLRQAGLTARQTSQWDLRDEVRRRGLPCTGIERTIIDCGSTTNLDTLERLAESAIRQELTTWQQIEEATAAHAGRGRNGPANVDRLIKRRKKQLKVARSDFGLKAKQFLVNAGLPEPDVEYQVTAPDGSHLLYLDIAWPRRRKAWELDSRQWHSGMEHFEADRHKRNAVKAQGWAIQEITWKMFDDPRNLVDLATAFLTA